MPDDKPKVPRTLRQRLMMEREEAYATLSIIRNAITELVAGAAVTSYTLQNRSVSRTRADLGSLKAYASELESRIYEIEAILSSRPQRQSTTNVYVNPSNCVPNWWCR